MKIVKLDDNDIKALAYIEEELKYYLEEESYEKYYAPTIRKLLQGVDTKKYK